VATGEAREFVYGTFLLRYAAKLEGRSGHKSSNALSREAAVVSRSTNLNCLFRASGVKVFRGAVEFFDNGIYQCIVVFHSALKHTNNLKLV
jgi:hypothetical protein